MFNETAVLGPMLTHWRQQKQWTLGQLAQRSGVSKASLSRWEAARVQPRVRELEAVLDALELPEVLRMEAFRCIRAVRVTRRIECATCPITHCETRDSFTRGGLPLTGELVQAIRSRAGLTQMEVAAYLGIHQSSVARWEATAGFPTEENLLLLRSLLKVTPEEADVLTQGPLIPSTLHGPDALDEARTLHARLEDEALFGTWNTPDLAFFQLEASLNPFAQTSPTAMDLLLQTYATHARFLVWRGRAREAKKYLDLLRKTRTDSDICRNGVPVPVQTGMVLEAEPLIHYRHRSVPTIIQRLVQQQSHITDLEHRAWLYMTAAEGSAILGQVDDALKFADMGVAVPMANGNNRVDDPATLLFRATVHIRSGYPTKALTDLERVPRQNLTPAQRTLTEVIRGHSYMKLGETAAASTAVQAGYSHLAHSGSVVYKACLDSMAEAM